MALAQISELVLRKHTTLSSSLPPQFAPEVHVGDGLGMDLKLSNQVFNSLKQHCYSEQRRSARLHEKKEHSTAVRFQQA